MPRSRVEIQKDVNIYKADVEQNNIKLNDPIWDNKYDPRYIDIIKARDNAALKLIGFERELAEAKTRGEKGRPLTEIREEILTTQSKINDFLSIQKGTTNQLIWFNLDRTISLFQCNINALQQELFEAIEEGNFKPQKNNPNKDKKQILEDEKRAKKEKAAREKAERERAEKEKREKIEKEKKRNNELAEIKKRYDEKIRKNPDDLNNYKIRATEYFLKGHIDLAIADYKTVIEKNPKDKEAHQGLSFMYSEKHDYHKCIEELTNVIDIDDKDAEIFALRGMAYSRIGEYNKGIADFDKAIKLNPKCKNAYLGKGTMYGVKGDHEKSVASYRGALLVDPSDSLTISLLENARNALKEQQRERKENEKKVIRKILCVSAPVLAVISLIMFYIAVQERIIWDFGYVWVLIISAIPFIVIFFSKYRTAKKIIFLIGDIIIWSQFWIYGKVVDRGVLVIAIITNLASVTLAMIFPKNKW
jgi:tetratricopeptide (TPR) repeat protein